MTTRRPLLALPFLLAARPLLAATPFRITDVSEVRLAGVDSTAMARRLGIPVRTVTTNIPAALNAGHLEAALLDRATAQHVARLMGPRLFLEPSGEQFVAIRQALPQDLRADLRQAMHRA